MSTLCARTVAVIAAVILISGCGASARPPMRTEPGVNLSRFMGDWYVIANIPTSIEEGAHNAVESYRIDEDGSIATTFTLREDSFEGELKRDNPRGFMLDTKSNAVWGMQFVCPIKADYRILHVSNDYTQTVIGREKRDYLWIMARTPHTGPHGGQGTREPCTRKRN